MAILPYLKLSEEAVEIRRPLAQCHRSVLIKLPTCSVRELRPQFRNVVGHPARDVEQRFLSTMPNFALPLMIALHDRTPGVVGATINDPVLRLSIVNYVVGSFNGSGGPMHREGATTPSANHYTGLSITRER